MALIAETSPLRFAGWGEGMGARDAERTREDAAQMSVELAVVFPIALALALIVVNGLSFIGSCASFDRIARNAIRLEATAPAAGVDRAQVAATIEDELQSFTTENNVTCAVTASEGLLGQVTYTASIDFAPTLFGLGLRDEVFGIPLPRLHHDVSLTVDPYRPGMIF